MKPLFKSKRMLTATLLALVMMVAVGATLALMASTSNQVTNTFAAADVDTEIEEVLTDGNKQVSIKNHGPSDAYVRARIMVSGVNQGTGNPFSESPDEPNDNMVQWTLTEKTPEELSQETNKVYIVFDQTILQNINALEKGKWFWDANRSGSVLDWYNSWFYYYDVLEAGKSTTNLIKKVQLTDDLAQDEEFLENFSVTIYHESVLAINQNLTGNVDSVKGVIINSFLAAIPETTPEPTP